MKDKDKFLFRGISVDNGKVIEGYGMAYSEEMNLAVIIHKQGINLMHHSEVIPESIHRFTGLFDYFKAEIWEGDKFKDEDDIAEYYLVEWNDILSRFQVNAYGYSISYGEGSQEIYSNDIELVDENIFDMDELNSFGLIKIGNIFINNEN